MFGYNVQITPFTDNLGNRLFSYISNECSAFSTIGSSRTMWDCSMLSTLRALLNRKIRDNETGECLNRDLKIGRIKRPLIEGSLNLSNLGLDSNTSYLVICEFDIPLESVEYVLVNRWGMEKVSKVTEFFSKEFLVGCFIDRERKVTMVYTKSSLSINHFHLLQSAIPAMLPWYFPDGVTKDEMELLSSLRLGNENKYLEKINEMANRQNFKEEFDKQILMSIGSRRDVARKREIDRNITEIMDSMAAYYGSLASLRATKRTLEDEYASLTARIAENKDGGRVYEIFKENKNIFLEPCSTEEQIVFTAKCIFNQNEDRVESCQEYLRNKGSVFYDDTSVINKKDLEKLWTAIFVTGEIRMWICAAYILDTSRFKVNGYGRFVYDDTRFKNCIPNPHVRHYSCIGGYEELFDEASAKGDIERLTEIAVASAGSINVHEGCTISKFVTDFQSNAMKQFLQLPDGTMVSPVEAVIWINSKEEHNDEQENTIDTGNN